MPKVSPVIPRFNGEVGPRIAGRIDYEQYPFSCETALNLTGLPQGGLARRPGTQYIAEVKNSNNNTYFIPFEYSVDQSYMIEGGASYFRFYRNQAQSFIETTDAAITNGTFDSDITGWTDQSGAGSSISHDATNDLMLVTSNGTTDGHAEQSVAVGASYQSNTHVLRFRVTGVAGDFLTVQVGTTSTGTELIEQDCGVGYHIIGFTPGAATIYVQFVNSRAKSIGVDDIEILSNEALELTTPFTASEILDADVPQANDVMYIFTSSTTKPYKLLRYGNETWSLEEVEFIDGPYLDQNIENILPSNATVGLGQKRSTATGSSTTLSPSAATGLGITITASAVDGINDDQGFLSTDVGRLVRIQDSSSSDAGYAIITGVSSTTQVTADVRRDFNATTATTRWWLGAISETTGYPTTGVFHQQRLVVAGVTDFPQAIMFSQTADIENMRPDSFVSSALTVQADDAMNVSLASTRSNAIRWLKSSNELIIGTSGGEWIIQPSSSSSVITPTDINALKQSSVGSSGINPVEANDSIIFNQRGSRKLYDYNYDDNVRKYRPRELTILAHTVTNPGLTRLAYAQEPSSIVYGVRTDGQVGAMTYKPDENKVTWARYLVGGTFNSGDAVVEDIGVIPGADGGGRVYDSGDRDEVWMVVKRTINGSTKRYIEVLQGMFEGPEKNDFSTDALWETQMLTDQKDAFYVDSGLTYDGSATTSITGLSHLEGETVKILADGAIHPDKTVSSGGVTLDYEASKVHIGLGYTHRYKSLKLNYGSARGTSIGKIKRVNRVTMVLLDAATFSYGSAVDDLAVVEFRETTDLMDTAVPLYTGERTEEFPGVYDSDSRIVIESDNPAPFVLLALAPEMKTNEK